MTDAAGLFGNEQVERARRYRRPLYAAALVDIVLGLALLAALSFTPLGDRVYAPFDELPWWAASTGVAAATVLLGALVRAPLALWSGYLHERAWGLSTQTLRSWAGDRGRSLAVALALSVPALVGLVGAQRWLPSVWPLVAAAAAAALLLLASWAAPVALEQISNRSRPLEDETLAAALRTLADEADVPVREVLVTDASRRTRRMNAYVSGLGSTRRVVLYDTLVDEAPPREVRLVVAHELAHRRARHVAKGTLLAVAAAVLLVVLLWTLLRRESLLDAIGATGPGDPRVIPFALLLGGALEALLSPLGSALSRRWERQADAFSLDLTRDPETFESIHRRLALANISDLDPPRAVYVAWFTHPTAPERITAARRRARA